MGRWQATFTKRHVLHMSIYIYIYIYIYNDTHLSVHRITWFFPTKKRKKYKSIYIYYNHYHYSISNYLSSVSDTYNTHKNNVKFYFKSIRFSGHHIQQLKNNNSKRLNPPIKTQPKQKPNKQSYPIIYDNYTPLKHHIRN
jgi:hypothetical protein